MIQNRFKMNVYYIYYVKIEWRLCNEDPVVTSLNSLTAQAEFATNWAQNLSIFSLIVGISNFQKHEFCVQGLQLLKKPKNQILFHRHFNW